ncbi:MAG: hypothetical protein PHY26_00665 [Bacilli bacterium]|jgi:hypothetical protein|nr:hypothetical protein [Bacilli bacterium]
MNWGNIFNNPNSIPNYNTNLKKPGVNWNGILNNTQKTLNIVNQAIPIFYQMKPVWNNAKTLMRVFSEFNNVNKTTSNTVTNIKTTESGSQNLNNNLPQFFT